LITLFLYSMKIKYSQVYIIRWGQVADLEESNVKSFQLLTVQFQYFGFDVGSRKIERSAFKGVTDPALYCLRRFSRFFTIVGW